MRGEAESPDGSGVVGLNNAITGNAFGVYGESGSPAGAGVYGIATPDVGACVGVFGKSNSAGGADFVAGGAGDDYASLSSIRWKSNIGAIDDPLGKLAQIRGVYYDWVESHGGRRDVGMIAEEVGAVLPEIVSYEANGIDAIGMDYSKMTPLLVEAVNALRAEKDAEIDSLHAENDAMRARLDYLEKRLEELTPRATAARTP